MRPAEITLHIVHNIARLALALVLANAHAVQAGQITVRHTLSALAIPVVARRAFARVGRYATSAIFAGSVKEKLVKFSSNNHFTWTTLTAHKRDHSDPPHSGSPSDNCTDPVRCILHSRNSHRPAYSCHPHWDDIRACTRICWVPHSVRFHSRDHSAAGSTCG